MENIEVIKKKILSSIKPDKKEKEGLIRKFEEIKRKILEKDKEGIIKKVELVGSVSKDTFIKGNRDLDIFMFFDPNISREELEDKGLEIGKKVFEDYKEEYVIKYAEHPYVKGTINGFEVEIVPAYALTSAHNIKSAVDRTPFHKEYVIKNLKNPDEVRILKMFMKSIGIYGSELYVRGFSGYACELMIIKYGTFENFLQHAQNFKLKDVICIEECSPHEARKKFRDDVFIVVDPVDPNRNVCASVSIESLSKLRLYAHLFMSKPSEKFFYIHKKNFAKENKSILKNLGRYWFIAVFKNTEEEIKDTIYPQVEKFRKLLLTHYEHHNYHVERSFSFADEKTYGVYFEFSFTKPSTHKVVKGPSIFSSWKRVEGFINKYRYYWLEDGMLNASLKRTYPLPEKIIESFKPLSPEERRTQGIPKSLARDFDTLKIVKSTQNLPNDFILRFTPESLKIAYVLK